MQLNKAQQEAVTHDTGPLCIIAGAGTGKTRVITQRIKYLITEKKVSPDEILAITFTEKGTAEMYERLAATISNADELWIHTFHGFCNKVIGENPLETGINEKSTLCEGAEKYLIIREEFDRLKLKAFRTPKNPTSGLQTLLDTFAQLKTEHIKPEQLDEIVKKQVEDLQKEAKSEKLSETKQKSLQEQQEKLEELARVYYIYQEIMTEHNAIEYGDMISAVLDMFEKHPATLDKYQQQFKYILVDEFQDTNTTQNKLINMLAANHRNITVVGDDDQAIFRFQGASLKNILEFNEVYPDAKKVVLTENYRSTKTILDASHEVLQENNPHRLEIKEGINKKLEAKGEKTDRPIQVVMNPSTVDQYEYVATEIQNLKNNNPDIQYKDIAILYRNHSSGRSMKDAVARKALPHIIHGGDGLFNVFEVHALKCVLRAITDINDSVNLFRVMTIPVMNIKLEDTIRLSDYASFHQMHISDVLANKLEELVEEGEIPGLTPDSAKPIIVLYELLQELREMAKTENVTTILFTILQRTGFLQSYINDQTIENIQKIYNINAFFSIAERFVVANPYLTVLDFLHHLKRLEEGGENPSQAELGIDVDAIQMMTIHKSKGLEFKVVFLIDVNEGKLPGRNISSPLKLEITDMPDRDAFIAEERRLFYVALTRAQERLYVTAALTAPGRKTEMKPSRFIAEIPSQFKAETIQKDSTVEHVISKLQTAPQKVAPDEQILRQMVEKIRLSATQIGSYLACPLNYKYKFVYNIPGRPGTAMSFGTKIHETLLYLHMQIKTGEKVSKEEMIKYWNDHWTSEGYFDEAQAMQLKQHGVEILSTYFDTHSKEFIPPLFLEQEFAYTIEREEGDNISLKGAIDRIDPVPGHKDPNAVHLIDYKTGKYKTANQIKGLRAEQRLYYQLLFYTLVCKEVLGLNPVKTSFYFIEENKWTEFSFTDADLKEFKETIMTVQDAIGRLHFEPKPDMQLCKWCDYRALCPTITQEE